MEQIDRQATKVNCTTLISLQSFTGIMPDAGLFTLEVERDH